jgi:hypothetical protein
MTPIQTGADRLETSQDVGVAAEETDDEDAEEGHDHRQPDHEGVDPGHGWPARQGAVWLAVKLSLRSVVLQESKS